MGTKILANLDFGGVAKPVNLAPTTAASDPATKQYVDNAVAGIANPKNDVKAVVTTTNLLVSNPGTATFDGYTASVGDRLLLNAQTAASENGIWVFNGSSAALTRPADFGSGSVQNGSYTFVTGGSTPNTGWIMTGTGPVTVDTTVQSWVQFSGLGDVTTGPGLQKSGNTISMVTPLGRFAVNIGDGSSTSITVTHNLGNVDHIVQVVDASGNRVLCDLQVGANADVLGFAVAPTSAAYRYVGIG